MFGDQVQKDFAEYAELQRKTVYPLETDAQAKLADVTKGISDMKMMAMDLRKGVVAKLEDARNFCRQHQAKTDEVKALNEQHITALGNAITAVGTLADGLENKDLEKIKAGKEGSDKAAEEMKAYMGKFRELGEKHGVEWKTAPAAK